MMLTLLAAQMIFPASSARCQDTISPTPNLSATGLAANALVKRKTVSATQDLFDQLVVRQQFQEARWLCQHALQGTNASEPDERIRHARWLANSTRLDAEEAADGIFRGPASELSTRFDTAMAHAIAGIQPAMEQVTEPELRVFLSAADAEARRRVLRAAIIASSVTSPADSFIAELIAAIARLDDEMQSVQRDAKNQWSKAVDQPNNSGGPDADSWQRLIAKLAIGRVSLALIQTELFAAGSQDYASAATDAASLAQDALSEIRADTPAAETATFLLAVSWLRSGRLDDVNRQLERVRPRLNSLNSGSELDADWLALEILYHLARRDLSNARQRVSRFYDSRIGDWIPTKTTSLELDLARLRLLLAEGNRETEVTAWLEQIEQNRGAFARRRAEALAVGALRSNATSNLRVSPALIAAQGEDWLRRNDAAQAATLLRQAALAETDQSTAFQYAAKSAAASQSSNDFGTAINTLLEVARKHADAPAAPKYAMQAALLASQPWKPKDDAAERVESLTESLREICQTWPASDTALQANRWLCRLLDSAGQIDAAAMATLEFAAARSKADVIDDLTQRWFKHLSQLDFDRCTETLALLTASLHEMAVENPALRKPIRRSAAVLLDTAELQALPTDVARPNDDGAFADGAFAERLLRFRLNATQEIDLTGASDFHLDSAWWRLRRDGLVTPADQSRIGSALMQWPNRTEEQMAMAALWKTPNEETLSRFNRQVRAAQSVDALRRAADLLSRTASDSAKQAGITLLDELANRYPIASPEWYDLKWRAIELTKQVIGQAEAVKRAKYILLLHPPADQANRRRFESASGEDADL